MNTPRKVFDLEQANALLPELEALLTELEAKLAAFRQLEDELFFEEILDQTPPDETRLQELEEALIRLEEDIERIRELGCLLRHAERGLVDFLARRGQEWVYYCWQRGEKEIHFFHTLRGGLLERQPLN